MTLPPDRVAEIIRLHYAEHWPVGTIAAQLGVHPDAVRHSLGLDLPRHHDVPRRQVIDPYRAFIADTLARYPTLRATRLYDMVVERGFDGGVRSVRRHVAEVRPPRRREIYLHTEPLAGEQAQVDWAYVSKLPVAGGERGLWLFVMVLGHSRAMWGEFVLDLSVHALRRSLVRAARAFGGVTRQWLFDNPKTVVLERAGDVVRFHPQLLDVAAALRVQPRLCAVRRPEHKGKVERAIRFLRDRFLAGRTIGSVADGNRALTRFIADIAHRRPHPTVPQRTVGEVFADELPRLLPLPDTMPDTDLVQPVGVCSQAFVRLDTNRYSVPTPVAERARALTLVADDEIVRILDGDHEVAHHVRSFGRRQIFELPEHRAELLRERKAARELKGRDRLLHVAPDFAIVLGRWALTGPSLGLQVTRAIRLLDLYGDDVFALAVTETASRGLRDVSALAVACDRLRRERRRPMPVDVPLPDYADDRDVIPHDLETYDD